MDPLATVAPPLILNISSCLLAADDGRDAAHPPGSIRITATDGARDDVTRSQICLQSNPQCHFYSHNMVSLPSLGSVFNSPGEDSLLYNLTQTARGYKDEGEL